MSRSAACITMPSMQLPHCAACSSMKACCSFEGLALLPRLVVLAMALTEPALAEKDSSEFSLLLYLFLTAWLLA